MTTDQLMLELFNTSLSLQEQTQSILKEIAINKENLWEIWFKYHIPNLLQLAAIGVGIWIMKHQLNKQHQSTLQAQKETIRTNLKLQLRSDLEQVIDSLNNMTAIAGNFPSSFRMSLIIARANQQAGIPFLLPQRIPKFNQDNADIQNAVGEIIKFIEKYEIVMPQLKIFQIAMAVIHTDIIFSTSNYFEELLKYLPFDIPEQDRERLGMSVYNRPLPTIHQETVLNDLGEKYSHAMGLLGCWIMDLRIELQNLTLGDLYPENSVPHRQPIDPIFKVIKTDPISVVELNDYFENSTKWGADKRIAEQSARSALVQT